MNNIALVYNSGHIKWYAWNSILRGASHEGQRPVEAYIDDNVSKFTVMSIIPILKHVDTEPVNDRIKPMYIPIDKYIELNGKLVQVHESQVTKELVYKSGDKQVVYDKLLDMETMSRNEAAGKYPEEFI